MIEALKILNILKRIKMIKDYAIGGGYGVNYYLEPIATYDLDIFILIDTDEDYHKIYEYFRLRGYRIENVYIVINKLPVQFFPSYISPLFIEAIEKAKKIKVNNISTKVISIEYLIATLLMAFRRKDKIVIPELLEMADIQSLNDILRRFSNEETPLYKRFKRILESI